MVGFVNFGGDGMGAWGWLSEVVVSVRWEVCETL